MKKIYLLIVSFFICFSQLHAQTSHAFTIDANGEDAAIDDYHPAQNNPNEIEYNTCAWTIGGVPVIWRDVFRFDLTCIPPNATITTAELNLYYATPNSFGNAPQSSLTSSNESVIQRVTSFWTENTVTWNTQPTTTAVDEVILPPSTAANQNYMNIDVKNIVQQMVSVPNGNFGFMLKLTNENYYTRLIFASGDHPNVAKHPYLNIKYSIPESDCITFRLDKICEDAPVDDYAPQNNNPDEIEYNTCAWTIFGTPTIWRDYFKFNLPCDLENATVTSSHLSLFYATLNGYGNTQHSSLTSSNESILQQVISPWSEHTINWYNQPSTTPGNQVTLQQTTSGTQDYTNIDVTNMVRLMQADVTQNYGFYLRLKSETYYARMIFASGDNPDSSKHPLLEVCYSLLTSVNNFDAKVNAVIFPNPFTDEIRISMKLVLNDATFEIYNPLSQLVFSKSSLSGDQFVFGNLQFADGIYFYRLTDNHRIIAEGKLQKTD